MFSLNVEAIAEIPFESCCSPPLCFDFLQMSSRWLFYSSIFGLSFSSMFQGSFEVAMHEFMRILNFRLRRNALVYKRWFMACWLEIQLYSWIISGIRISIPSCSISMSWNTDSGMILYQLFIDVLSSIRYMISTILVSTLYGMTALHKLVWIKSASFAIFKTT